MRLESVLAGLTGEITLLIAGQSVGHRTAGLAPMEILVRRRNNWLS